MYDRRFRQISGENHTNSVSTVVMVGVLVLVVMLVFVCFALMAVCYRYIRFLAMMTRTKY